jgi:membrane protein implicated in regulation of membrane protease activity
MRHEVQFPARGRRPSRLGIGLAFGLLATLLAWRLALPAAPAWLDAVLLAAVGVVLLAVRARLRGRRKPPGG